MKISEIKNIRKRLAEITFKYDTVMASGDIYAGKSSVVRGLDEKGFTVTAKVGVEIGRNGEINVWNKSQKYSSARVPLNDLMEMCNELSDEFEFLWPLEES